jgi:hypothetical protein
MSSSISSSEMPRYRNCSTFILRFMPAHGISNGAWFPENDQETVIKSYIFKRQTLVPRTCGILSLR